jgi:hypothetical protein
MTSREALNSLMEPIADERTTIENQMKNIYPIPGGFAFDKGKPNETTRYDPTPHFHFSEQDRIDMMSALQGQLQYNGQVQDHIRRLMMASKW